MIELTLRVANSIGDVAAEAWDACANPAWPDRGNGAGGPCPGPANLQSPALGDRYNPFIAHDFLSALEVSQSVRGPPRSPPMHLLAEDAAGGLLARAGPYADAVRAHLADALTDICRRAGASSVHVTFPTEPEWDLLGARGYLKRTHQQFHWENAGYATFDAFLAALASRKRKTIRRERADALAAGISVHWLTGTHLTESVWDAFFNFYLETCSRKWGRPYLTREFYSLVGEKMRDHILPRKANRNPH